MATPLVDSQDIAIESFRSALRGGFGRALRLARELGPETATDLLLEAMEGREVPEGPGTADWLLDLAAECRAETLLSRLLAAKIAPHEEVQRDDLDVEPVLGEARPLARDVSLLARLAGDGDEGARSALYRHFVRRLDDSGTRPIMALDGIEGFLFVVETLGQCIVAREDFQLDLSVYRDACRRLGRDRVEIRLERRAARSRYAAAFLDCVRSSGASGGDLGVLDGPACDLNVIAPDAEELRAALEDPAGALGQTAVGALRAGLVHELGLHHALSEELLRELLLDAHASVRQMARRYFRGGLNMTHAPGATLSPGGGIRQLRVDHFEGEGEAPFEMTEIFAALRVREDWASDAEDRRGHFAADALDVMHLRPRQARDLRVTLVDWLTDDPFFPVPIAEIIDSILLANGQLSPGARVFALLAPRLTDDAPTWESYSEWWVVDENARALHVIRFGTPL